MNQNIVIDVTQIAPAFRHPTVFQAFDDLDVNETILLHNDHDPKPLYYQLLGKHGNTFSWDYKMSGPDIWEVEIARNTGSKGPTVGEIVGNDMRKADVFKKLGIDFCCGGKKPLDTACAEKGLDVNIVKEQLAYATSNDLTSPVRYSEWPLSFLVDYIVNIHHDYIRKNDTVLTELSEKVASRHGDNHEELIFIKELVEKALCELNVHMKKEEHILFPYIKQLENNEQKTVGFHPITEPISVMENDHDIVGKLFQDIRQLSNNYTPPANACNSYKLLFHKLEEFENDLHIHVHLENNILFPRAVAIETGR